MLERPTSKAKRTRERALHRIASRLYRQRVRDGEFILPVPVNAMVLDWMIEKAQWISEADAAEGDRGRLGLLVGDGLKLSAKNAARKSDQE
jgi:hypothetical protein